MLLAGRQDEHLNCKSSATTIPNSLVLGTGVTWSNLTWSILEYLWKHRLVKQKPVSETMFTRQCSNAATMATVRATGMQKKFATNITKKSS